MTYYGRWTYKFEQAARLGAAGCLVLHNTAAASYGWHVCQNGHVDSNLALYDTETRNEGELALKGWFHEDGCRKLFEAAGVDFDATLAAAKQPGFKARHGVSREVPCSALKGETVPDSLPATPKSHPTRRVNPRRTPRVPAPLPLSPFSPPDRDRRGDSPAWSGRGSRPSRRTSG